jgi:hypothetical protein
MLDKGELDDALRLVGKVIFNIIETVSLTTQEKNADELFQNFVWHTRDCWW